MGVVSPKFVPGFPPPPAPLPSPPKWIPPKSTTPTRAASSRSSRERSQTLGLTAAGSRAALIYGRVQMVPEIAAVAVSGGYLYLLLVWGLGEIEAVESITIDSGLTSQFEVTHYLGTSSQGVDPWLAAAISGYADTLRGTVHGRSVSLAYSVMRTNQTGLDIGRDFIGTVQGRLVYDPRTPGYAYSTNPALALADVLTMAGETMDWASVETAADFCDETVGGAARWTLNMLFDAPDDVTSLAEELRAYAHCLIVPGADGLQLVPDTATATSLTLTSTDIMEGSLQLSRKSRRETPTVVRVEYTNTETTPWGEGTAEVKLAEVDAGTAPWRESNTAMHGIQTYAEAYRTARERLKAYNLRDLRARFSLADAGLAVTPGDVVSLTHPWGLTNKLLRVLSVSANEAGRWNVDAEEYDPAVYTDSIQSAPTYWDTELPSPFDVPDVTGLSAQEEVYQLENGVFASRLRVTWSAADYPYAHKYLVKVSTGGQVITSGFATDAVWVTGPLQEGNTYTITVAIVGDLVGVTGASAQTSVVAQGKQIPPGNVATLSGFEVGGQVRLNWTAAADIDIWRYEVRYGLTTADWDDMTVLDRVDGLRLVTNDVPSGTWRFAVRAIDSIGQYSPTAATRDLEVTLDTRAFFVGQYDLPYDSSASLYADVWRDGTVRRWSEEGRTVNTVFTAVADTYTDVAAAYDGGVSSEYLTETHDYGAIYVGNWQFDSSQFDALGTGDVITVNHELSTDSSTWAAYTDPTVKVAARYARVRASSGGGNVLLHDGRDPKVRLDVVTREETGNVTTSASGATTVTLSQSYQFVNAILLQPSGTVSVSAVYDNVLIGPPTTFDIYLFDASGTQISGPVTWRFQGV